MREHLRSSGAVLPSFLSDCRTLDTDVREQTVLNVLKLAFLVDNVFILLRKVEHTIMYSLGVNYLCAHAAHVYHEQLGVLLEDRLVNELVCGQLIENSLLLPGNTACQNISAAEIGVQLVKYGAFLGKFGIPESCSGLKVDEAF